MSTIQKRADILQEDTWRLEDFFATDEDFKKETENLGKDAEKLMDFKGKLGSGEECLGDCLDFYQQIYTRQERMYVYANMRLNQDEGNTFYAGLSDIALALVTKISSISAFLEPEILEIPDDLYKTFEKHPRLFVYKHYLDGIRSMKAHILDEKSEYLLALSGEALSAAGDIYNVLTDADMSFGMVKDPEGVELELTSGRFINFLRNEDRDFRKTVYYQYYAAYEKLLTTLATTYKSSIHADLFVMRARSFKSILDMNLYPKNIPLSVYENLINTVGDSLGDLHRYMEVRKEILGLEDLQAFDMYAPLVKEVDTTVTYDVAMETIKKSLLPLGDDYLNILDRCFTDRWVDKFENKGKASGAYSWGAYSVHPYILMNYDNELDDMFTLTHEAGHALHRHFSIENQPIIYYNNDIFTAEVASTFNESMLVHYLLETETDTEKRKYILNHFLDMFRGTIFRQTQFAEFEWNVHLKAEAGTPIGKDVLNDMYQGLNIKYYGKGVNFPEIGNIEWARIPHFYRSYYVYQYATGFAAAISLSKAVLEKQEGAVKRYLEFLKGGSHQYPIDLLKAAGVDMESEAPVRDALSVFKSTLDEFIALSKR